MNGSSVLVVPPLFQEIRTPEGAKRAKVTRLPSIKLLEKELSHHHAWRTFSARSLRRLMEGQAEAPGQAGSGCSRALFGQPLAALCGEDGTLPQPIQELLDILHQQGPSTEGIFRLAASGTAFRELREALDSGADVDLGSQPVLLLAVILKDFLRSIPAKLLVTDLYEDWMAAMQKSVKEEKVEELKAVAEKLPAANLLLLKRLLSLLQHIGHNASTSRMSCSNLAICLGPNLLSPASEDLLPLEAMLEVTQKVKVLVEFLIENHCEVFGEETTGLSSPSAEASPAPMDRSTELPLEEQRGPAGDADMEHQAKAFLDTPASLLVLQKAAGADTVAGSETAEAPVALPPSTPQTTADSLGSAEELKGLSEERRFAGSRRDNENQGKRKRQEVWADERECQRAKKRRKTEKDGD
ncbi:T-cell activation Rho GTPase-activating protein-like [Calonectris borealis]|uniref:T-cell activation Rho GTPase-activating protein-like n=3 Tax=Calonectris borealis TaxID=1323832 RepID=UPI003F4CADAE